MNLSPLSKMMIGTGVVGAIGLSVYKMTHHGAAPATAAQQGDAGAQAPTAATPPQSGVPGLGTPAAGAQNPAGGAPSDAGAQTQTQSQLPAGARQVGNYIIVPDAQTGYNIAYDATTKQPVAVLDQQGNDITQQVMAQTQQQQTAGTGTGVGTPVGNAGAGPQLIPGQDAGSAVSGGVAAGGAPGSQQQTGATQDASAGYAQLAQALFAQARQSGTSTGGGADGTQTPAAAPAANTTGAATSGLTMIGQAGQYSVFADAATGAKLVVDPATKALVGVLDQQGNIVPIPQSVQSAQSGAGAVSAPSAQTASGAQNGAPVGGGPAVSGLPTG